MSTKSCALDEGPCSSWSFSISRSPQWMPSSRLVSHVESSSSRNGGAFSRLSRKKKNVFGIFGESDLRRGNAGEDRHRDAVFLPAHRVAEHAQESRGALPAIARDISHAHRRGPVLQHDEIHAALPQCDRRPVRPRERDDDEHVGEDDAQPEGQVIGERESRPRRRRAAMGYPACVTAPDGKRQPRPAAAELE